MKTQYFKNVLAAQFSRQAIKLSTVNVIEMINSDLQSVHSFADNPEGNDRAERLFKRCMKEFHHGFFPPSYYDNAVEMGWYQNDSGYQLFLCHST